MEAAAQHVSSVSAPVNPTPAWTVEGLRTAIRDRRAGLPATVQAANEYLRRTGLSISEAIDRAYGTASSTKTTIFTLQEAADLAASFACLWQDGVDGPDCRESVPFDPESWCPMCVAREAVGQ